MWNRRSPFERRQRRRAVLGVLLRVLAGLLIVKIGLWYAWPTPAKAAERKAAQMAIDANTGAVLANEAGDEPRYPASLTKMMTIYLAFEAIEQGRTSLTRKVKFSQEATSAAPSKLDLDPGEEITLGDAIKALITKSANDAAIAVAEHLAGSEARFAQVMTDKARALGMSRTTFKNASGLPDPGQVTTARDMLTLALRLQDDFPRHYPLFALRTASINGSSYKNHNTLLGQVEGVDGIKTGYTRTSGFNLVTSMRRGEKHVVAAVFGGPTAGVRNMQMRALLNRALARASSHKTRKPAPQLIARVEPSRRMEAKPAAITAPVVAAPAPIPVPEPRRAVRPAPVVIAAPAPAPSVEPIAVAVAPAPAQPKIEVARVRPVMVAMRPRPPAETAPRAAEPVASSALPVVAAAPPLAPVATVVPTPPVATTQTAAPATRPAPTLAAPPLPAPAAPVAALRTARAAVDAFVPQRGSPPSTLQAQADALNRAPGLAQPAYALRGPAPQSAAVGASGGFQIQIGSYATAAEAERALADARTRASDLVGAAAGVASPGQKNNRQLFRARFAGFDAQRAAGTCLELRRRNIDCFVMKAE